MTDVQITDKMVVARVGDATITIDLTRKQPYLVESYAGYLGDGTVVFEAPSNDAAMAALAYWRANNDGTWPLDRIDWEE